MSIASWARRHRADIRLVIYFVDSAFFVLLPVAIALGGYFTGESTLEFAAVAAATAFLSSVRLLIKQSPIIRRLGVESVSGDLERTE